MLVLMVVVVLLMLVLLLVLVVVVGLVVSRSRLVVRIWARRGTGSGGLIDGGCVMALGTL